MTRNKPTNVELENPKRRHDLEEMFVDGTIVLIWIFKECSFGIWNCDIYGSKVGNGRTLWTR